MVAFTVMFWSSFSTVYVNPAMLVTPSGLVALNLNSQLPSVDASEPL